jgi:hypothetical protein
MKQKPKLCDGCGKISLIWKNNDGKKYCKYCSAHIQKKSFKILSFSHKQKNLLKEYYQRRNAFLAIPANKTCRAKLANCTGSISKSLTIHHSRGRGKYLLDETSWIPLCAECHRWVEEHPKEAKEIGLSFSRLETTEITT